MSRVCLHDPTHVAPDDFSGSYCVPCAQIGHSYRIVEPSEIMTCANGHRHRADVPGRAQDVCPSCGAPASTPVDEEAA